MELTKIYRSSRPEVLLGKGALKICSKFTWDHQCRSAISIKLQNKFIEITLRHGCSPVNLLHIFRTSFPKNTYGGLFLNIFRLLLWVIILSGETELPLFFWNDPFSTQDFTILHWNLNSISAHIISLNFCTHIITCFSEPQLNSETSSDDESLEITGKKNIIREDQSPKREQEGTCVYCKDSLSFKVFNVKYLQKCISNEIAVFEKRCKFVCLHKFPSQTHGKFEAFL